MKATKELLEMNVRLTDQDELNNYLTYGKWDLDEKQIERLKKDEEMKQRVREGDDEMGRHQSCNHHRMDNEQLTVLPRLCSTHINVSFETYSEIVTWPINTH